MINVVCAKFHENLIYNQVKHKEQANLWTTIETTGKHKNICCPKMCNFIKSIKNHDDNHGHTAKY